MKVRAEVKRRLSGLEPREGQVRVCNCAGQLQAIGEARVAVDGNGICQYCHRPISGNWGRFAEGLQRAYGEVQHAN
jgi:hypothetical protein